MLMKLNVPFKIVMSVSAKENNYYIQLFAIDHLNGIKASVHISGSNYLILFSLCLVITCSVYSSLLARWHCHRIYSLWH